MSRALRPAIAFSLIALAASCGGGEEREPVASREGAAPAAAAPAASAQAAPDAAKYVASASVANAGSVRGVVKVEGPVPKLGRKEVTQDHAACGTDQPNLNLVLGKDNGVEGAVVRLTGIGAGKAFATGPLVLDQQKCRFIPHVTVVPAGSKVEMKNSDPVAHNVHAYDAENTSLFNLSTPLQGMSVDATLDKPGPVRLKCDVHPWMSAWFWVADTPYVAATGKDGAFEITDVPAGTYRITVWHELLGERTEEVTVPASGAATKDLALRAGG